MTDEIPTQHYDDEIDLIELLAVLWAEKLLILAATVLSVLGLLGITLTSTTQFEVRTPYYIHEQLGCAKTRCSIPAQIQRLTNDQWFSVDGDGYLLHPTDAPKSAADYQSDLATLNQALSSTLLNDARATVDIIESAIPSHVQQIIGLPPELLFAKKVIHYLEGGTTPLRFGDISIASDRKPGLLSVAGAFLGALMGSVFVLFRNAFRRRSAAGGSIGH
jgi:hypothetical protein